MRDKMILRILLVMLAAFAMLQTCAGAAEARGVEGFERMGYPREAVARAAAEARVLEVYEAIDEATDDPEVRRWLRWRCKRESWCNWYQPMAIHKEAAGLGRKRWKRSVDKGLLFPDECEAHQLGDEPGWWSTVGSFGNVSSYVMRHAGECVSPREMVDPRVSAALAVAHLDVLCRRHKACTCDDWARWWAGPGRWSKHWRLRQLRVLTSQCGPRPWEDWATGALVDAGRVLSMPVRSLGAAAAW